MHTEHQKQRIYPICVCCIVHLVAFLFYFIFFFPVTDVAVDYYYKLKMRSTVLMYVCGMSACVYINTMAHNIMLPKQKLYIQRGQVFKVCMERRRGEAAQLISSTKN